MTTISAFIACPGTPQRYRNVPAVENVCRKVPDVPTFPESNAPVSEVTVWETESWFVQQTVAPGATVADAGEYENPLIETSVSPGWHPTCASALGLSATASAAASRQKPVSAPSAFITSYYDEIRALVSKAGTPVTGSSTTPAPGAL